MRPSNKPGVVAVLDTLAECKVVNDAFDDPDFQYNSKVPLTNEELEDCLRQRFIQQAMHLPDNDPYATELNFVANPEFDVQRGDAFFVLKTAERIINQKVLAEKAFNVLTGRSKAAKGIIRFLASRED